MKRLYVTIFYFLFCVTFLQAQRIVFTPQWTAHSQFVGYYVALEKGFYKEVGLDVIIDHPSRSNPSYNKMIDGSCDIITSQLADAMMAFDKGIDVVNILQVSQNSALVIVSQPQFISLEQLKGKKIAGWVKGFCTPVQCMDKYFNLNFEWVYFQGGINIFTSNAVDAILAMSYNELFVLENCGKRISEKNIIYVSDYEGFNLPEDGLYCLREKYEINKDAYDKFAQASIKGWEYADTHREEALEIVVKVMNKENSSLNLPHQQFTLDKILALRLDKKTNKATYLLTKEVFSEANDMLLDNGFISKPIDYNTFVPKQ